ncbi:ferredoxin [Leptospira kobayashii]|uniref:(2Fe-2S) ferredoxin domain-containing protein n=2 Tax=Leptospira TaxID=171 RepID=A0A4R9LMQ0_9LEPT|nr:MULTISPECIES: (2Fe-2S) ferredoxin domain-containing protein [Leptospira]TGN09841.1 (2Fe-2S) ferredoxin domain-containing protein [Leptospira ilyithenensis]BDA80400.1 ferredoxin [Leptospira kobayashii]
MERVYDKHFFVCENKRAPGERVSCGNQGSEEILKLLKKKSVKAGITYPFRIQRAGCMERCELGPVQVCYPEGKWFKLQTEADVDIILEHYFKNDDPSAYEHLLVKE